MFFAKKENRKTWWNPQGLQRGRAKVSSITEVFGLDESCDEQMTICGVPEHEEEIRLIAYFKWLDAGCKENTDLDDWLEAEKEYWQAATEDRDQAIMELSMEEEKQYAEKYLEHHS
jgi:hypothetical protein